MPSNSPPNPNDLFCENIYPKNISISIAHVFTTFLKHLSGKNTILPQPVSCYHPFRSQALLNKQKLFFDLPNIEQLRTIENNPHHWLTTDILQIRHFHYQFFQNLTLIT